jgi:hypothetical protein
MLVCGCCGVPGFGALLGGLGRVTDVLERRLVVGNLLCLGMRGCGLAASRVCGCGVAAWLYCGFADVVLRIWVCCFGFVDLGLRVSDLGVCIFWVLILRRFGVLQFVGMQLWVAVSKLRRGPEHVGRLRGKIAWGITFDVPRECAPGRGRQSALGRVERPHSAVLGGKPFERAFRNA